MNLELGLSLLEPIKQEFGATLSWADLIILAGSTALELAGNISLPFCTVGRVDAEDGGGWQFLYPRVRFSFLVARSTLEITNHAHSVLSKSHSCDNNYKHLKPFSQ